MYFKLRVIKYNESPGFLALITNFLNWFFYCHRWVFKNNNKKLSWTKWSKFVYSKTPFGQKVSYYDF